MSLRLLLSALVALTVLFAPAATAAAANATVPDHQMQMMEAGHCKSMPASDHDQAPDKSCCIAMCLGLAVTHSPPIADVAPQPVPVEFAVPILHVSISGEIATPPPRLS
jgi:hypothetical protein